MDVIYDIHSEYWRSIYRKLFDEQGVTSNRLDKLELERRLLANVSIDVLKDPDGRWIAVKIPSQEDAVRLKLIYGE